MTHSPLPDPTTRRGRRIERQQRTIMDAAARIFAEKGYAATTTRDIAEAADIGESTLYNYFLSKRDILLAIATSQAEMLDAVLDDSGRIESRDQMVAVFVQVTDILLSQTHYTRALIAEAWINDEILFSHLLQRLLRISHFLEELIARRVESGQFRPLDPRMGARMVISAFLGVILPALRGLEPLPSAEERRAMAESVIGIWLDGVESRTRGPAL